MTKRNFMLSAIAVALSAMVMLTGCSAGNSNSGNGGKKKIYATISPVYDFTRKIAGDKQNVQLIAAGDIHHYEPSAIQMTDLEKASMIVYNGLGIDSFVNNIGGNSNAKMVDASKGTQIINTAKLPEGHSADDGHDHSHDHSEAGQDPHIWLYPQNAKIQMANIRDALIEIDGANADTYNANYEKYAKQCDELDDKFKSLAGKNIVTTHGAYAYWAEKYGINVISMDTAGEEVSPAKMKEIVDFCKANNITTIYYEEGGSEKNAKAVANEIGGKVDFINAFEHALHGKNDYFAVMEQNYKALSK